MLGAIFLCSSDGKDFLVERDVIAKSEILNTMIQDLGLENKDEPSIIPLTNVDSVTLEKVLEWCRQHKEDNEPAARDDLKKKVCILPEWDRQFLKIDNNELVNVLKAANYLNIPKLLDFSAQIIADRLKDKTPEETRVNFDIKTDDFTEEEKDTIRAENAWCAD